MAVNAFLAAVEAYLRAAGLTPVPAAIGIAEPEKVADLPAVVLSLESVETAGAGLGERATLITDGVLPWQAAIDLANPVLPEDPSFRLLNDARTVLILPHGGLVKQDGSQGPLTGADLTVKVGGSSLTVVAGVPAGGQVTADPVIGQLTFGTALSAMGTLEVTYFLGQWEQRIRRIAGVLRVDVCAGQEGQVSTLSSGVVDALLLPKARSDIHRLLAIRLSTLSSIGPREKGVPLRRRTARFSYVFEHEINQPESSGGIIGRIPITTKLNVATVDKNTGAIQTTVTTVPG